MFRCWPHILGTFARLSGTPQAEFSLSRGFPHQHRYVPLSFQVPGSKTPASRLMMPGARDLKHPSTYYLRSLVPTSIITCFQCFLPEPQTSTIQAHRSLRALTPTRHTYFEPCSEAADPNKTLRTFWIQDDIPVLGSFHEGPE